MTSTLRFQLNQRFQLAIIAPFTVVAVIAVLAALALVLNIDRRVVTVSAIVAGSYPAFVTISNIAARQRILRDIEQMLAGGYWAHWQYDPTFWQQHAPETLFGRTIRKYELSIPNLVRSGFLLALVSGIITGVSILWHSTVMSAITASLIVSIATFVLRLPIPEDCLDEAAVLVSRLQAELVPQQSS